MSAQNQFAEENRRLRQENEAVRLQRDAFESQKEALQSQADALRSQTEALRIELQELQLIRRNLEHTIAVYQRCLFGSRSEKVDPKELEARIAQAAAEAREQLAQEKRPGDPPPEAEEEQPEAKADSPTDKADPPADQPDDPQKEKKRKARPHGRGGFPAHLPRRRIEHFAAQMN
jgi:septal ring factor EnvC (AmiA/AmiB activator)